MQGLEINDHQIREKLTDLINNAIRRQRTITLSRTGDKKQLEISPVGVFLVIDGEEKIPLSPSDLKEELKASFSPVRKIIELEIICHPDLEIKKGIRTRTT